MHVGADKEAQVILLLARPQEVLHLPRDVRILRAQGGNIVVHQREGGVVGVCIPPPPSPVARARHHEAASLQKVGHHAILPRHTHRAHQLQPRTHQDRTLSRGVHRTHREATHQSERILPAASLSQPCEGHPRREVPLEPKRSQVHQAVRVREAKAGASNRKQSH